MAKILIVDDDPGTRQLYVSLLSPFGHEVAEAGDGEEGLKAARTNAPGLVVSDILMPTMNGYEFVLRLRQLPSFETIPVIFQSASFLDHETQALGRACGVIDFISKPCEAEEILGTINRVLGLPVSMPVSASPSDPTKAPVPLLLDAFYEKGKQLDALSLRLVALLELGQRLSLGTEPRTLLEASVDAAREIIGANYAGAGTMENGGPELRLFVTRGFTGRAGEINVTSVDGVFREIALEGKTVSVFCKVGEPISLALPLGHPPVRGLLGMPIRTGSRTYGFIYVADKLLDTEFTTEDERFLGTIAAKLAIA